LLVGRRAFLVAALAVGLAACSDSAASVEPGSFRVRLSGVRTATLFGPAIAENSFAEDRPEHHYVIRMHAFGETVQTIALLCRGSEPPRSGAHELSRTGEDCLARYTSVLVHEDMSVTLLDSASAVSGELAVEAPAGDQLGGTFSFSGPLVAGSDTLGTLRVGGSFSADRQ
jgi:hypothetical protein